MILLRSHSQGVGSASTEARTHPQLEGVDETERGSLPPTPSTPASAQGASEKGQPCDAKAKLF